MYIRLTFLLVLECTSCWPHGRAVVKTTAISLVEQLSFGYSEFMSSGYIPSGKISGLYGNPISNFSRNLHVLFS